MIAYSNNKGDVTYIRIHTCTYVTRDIYIIVFKVFRVATITLVAIMNFEGDRTLSDASDKLHVHGGGRGSHGLVHNR